MSEIEFVEAQGSSLAYALTVGGFFLSLFVVAWMAVHGGPVLLAVWERGRVYRRRLRAAKHRRPVVVRRVG